MKKTLSMILLSSLLSFSFVSGVGPLSSSPSAHAASSSDAEFSASNLKHVNEERAKVGTKELKRSKKLDEVAEEWTKKMLSSKTLAHNPSYYKQIPAGWYLAGENVAYAAGYGSQAEDIIHKGLMNSPGHKRNILNTSYNYVGIAFVTSGAWTYATQVFAQYSSNPDGNKANPTIEGFSKGITTAPKSKVTWKNVKLSHAGELQKKNSNGSWTKVKNLKKGNNTVTVTASSKYDSKDYYRIIIKGTSTINEKKSTTVKVSTLVKSSISSLKKTYTVEANKKLSLKKVKVNRSAKVQVLQKGKWTTLKTLKKGTHNVTIKANKKKKITTKYRIYIPKSSSQTLAVKNFVINTK